MRIEGQCHCGNIRYALEWPGKGERIPVRACGCTFCMKHGGVWTSNREASLAVTIGDAVPHAPYRFGTGTAAFHVCARCGAVPVVTSEIEGKVYAVVNVNTFEGVDPSSFDRAPANFDGETTDNRLDRRKQNWIPDVRMAIRDR
ncbi:MAG: hypothetical protein U1F33_13545 [Alphaproteobacteria bacterium]